VTRRVKKQVHTIVDIVASQSTHGSALPSSFRPPHSRADQTEASERASSLLLREEELEGESFGVGVPVLPRHAFGAWLQV
jgi:hypothetical protein